MNFPAQPARSAASRVVTEAGNSGLLSAVNAKTGEQRLPEDRTAPLLVESIAMTTSMPRRVVSHAIDGLVAIVVVVVSWALLSLLDLELTARRRGTDLFHLMNSPQDGTESWSDGLWALAVAFGIGVLYWRWRRRRR